MTKKHRRGAQKVYLLLVFYKDGDMHIANVYSNKLSAQVAKRRLEAIGSKHADFYIIMKKVKGTKVNPTAVYTIEGKKRKHRIVDMVELIDADSRI